MQSINLRRDTPEPCATRHDRRLIAAVGGSHDESFAHPARALQAQQMIASGQGWQRYIGLIGIGGERQFGAIFQHQLRGKCAGMQAMAQWHLRGIFGFHHQ